MAKQVGFLFCVLSVFPVFKDCLMLLCPFSFSFSLLGQCFLKGVPWNLDARGFVKYKCLGILYVLVVTVTDLYL
jgi:hypothetical protein